LGGGQEIRKGIRYRIRSCRNIQELRACVDLQNEVWGYAEREAYPLRMFVNLERIGGSVLGAFTSASRLVGFAASMPAWHGAHRYYHSMSLGVLPAFQNRGIGQALKWEQRRRALRVGIDCIEWTFDPTRARNAFLNLERLGGIVRRYVPDYYGALQSRLQRGLASDRLICEWWLNSARVRRAAKAQPPRSAGVKPAATIPIPQILVDEAASHAQAARAKQLKLRKALLGRLQRGYVITGFCAETSAYLLDRNFTLTG
jgi:predicted GNAT superfamily acetyltransferase